MAVIWVAVRSKQISRVIEHLEPVLPRLRFPFLLSSCKFLTADHGVDESTVSLVYDGTGRTVRRVFLVEILHPGRSTTVVLWILRIRTLFPNDPELYKGWLYEYGAPLG